jgi:RNA polymerase sigma-70 factor (ECF subfamily)
MSEETSFQDLIRRVQAGDDRAAAELVQRYEPTIRLVVRRRLTDPKLRRLLDSMDICQSVLATFFVGAAAGQFDLDTPEHLLKLLATMARNKLTSCARKQQAARRNVQRVDTGLDVEGECVDPSPSPSQVVANQELLNEVRRRLSPDERRLQDLHAAGRSWAEIAAEVGGTPAALRMQLSRAIDRVKCELGIDD